MVFIDKGEASQAPSSLLQMGQSMAAVAKALADLLEELARSRQQNKEEKEETEEKTLTPEQEKTVDELCATAAIDRVTAAGTDYAVEGGGIQRVYQAESYTVSTDPLDGTGYPVYNISTPTQGEVLSFQETPSGGLAFFETANQLEDEQKAELLNALANQVDSPAIEKTGLDRVTHQLKTLGDFAPAGSRAVLVADRLLSASGKSQLAGNVYQFSRAEDGGISIAIKDNRELFKYEPSGQIAASSNVTDRDLGNFRGMHSALSALPPQTAQKAPKTPKVQPELGDR